MAEKVVKKKKVAESSINSKTHTKKKRITLLSSIYLLALEEFDLLLKMQELEA